MIELGPTSAGHMPPQAGYAATSGMISQLSEGHCGAVQPEAG